MFLFLSSVAAGYAQPTLRAVGYLAPMATKKKGMLTAASERGKHLRPFGKKQAAKKERAAAKVGPNQKQESQ